MQIVIVGAGQAGAALAARLRTKGHEGPITMIGDENAPPYQRPPLSKAYLMGDIGVERLWLRAPEFWDETRIDMRLGTQAERIDVAENAVLLSDGSRLNYDHLALTTGSAPRQLPAAIGGDLDGVYTVRSLSDVDAMRGAFTQGKRVVIVGGGYIGLEAAAVASKLGLDVTVVEMAPRILQRVAAPQTSDYFRDLHRAHGVAILEGVGLERLISGPQAAEGQAGRAHVSGAKLSDGRILEADFVIVGVGITPNTALAESAGIVIDNGIATDSEGRTSVQNIWAAGDCASFPWHGERVRLESVGNAIAQADTVADNMLGAERAYEASPWFWSDQYECKLQIAGLNTGYDRVITRLDEAPGAVSFWYYKGTQLLAIDAMNDPRAYMVGKRLIEKGKSPTPEKITSSVDLKSLLT